MAHAPRGRPDGEQIIVRGLKNATTDDLDIVAWANHLVMAAHELETLLSREPAPPPYDEPVMMSRLGGGALLCSRARG